MNEKYFPYGDEEITYLKNKDKKLAVIIDELGHLYRPVSDDLFTAVVHNIIGQQISTKAHATIWKRMTEAMPVIDPQAIVNADIDELQSFGMTYKKAGYIHDFAEKIVNKEFDLEAVSRMTDEEAIKALSSLNGIGVWTAEMLLLHTLKRPNILSYGDLAILRGMRMVYRHRKIDKKLFEKYRRRLSPYCSVASIYFWKVSAGALPQLTDPAAGRRKKT